MAKKVASSHSIPFWRDIRVLRVIAQVAFLTLIAAGIWWLFNNLQYNLHASGLRIGFRFLTNTAGFPISEGLRYSPTDVNGYAFLVGIVNTIKVAVIGIVLATIIGVVVGISRLSSNWLVRKLAGFYVEVVRNIPLLVQLFFWYFAVMLTALPLVKNSIHLPGSIYLTRRGVYMPWATMTDSFGTWAWYILGGLIVGVGVYMFRRTQLKRAERPGFPIIWAGTVFVLILVTGWLITPGNPLNLSLPVLKKFNFEGGLSLSTSFTALLIGLSVYTAAFIAEIVRAGILAISRGQTEAASAVGLSKVQVLRLVILPQALRVIIPPLASQYLNLTKNSSLAILIGYYDLMNVGTTIFNQTGRAVEMILLIMASYLTMSLLTSLAMNYYNKRMKLVER
ncbi:MAG: amino acid ABC transporter permease [Candidatus Thorarchaeota archaeon]|nr:ABC transporter permease subunit [Candidatus Acetothermia bacterium]